MKNRVKEAEKRYWEAQTHFDEMYWEAATARWAGIDEPFNPEETYNTERKWEAEIEDTLPILQEAYDSNRQELSKKMRERIKQMREDEAFFMELPFE